MVSATFVTAASFDAHSTSPGNCLFASLSDQMYGTPAKHVEIRLSIIEHMRTLRPLFEQYVHKDDVQQRRALRSATSNARKESDDAFEYTVAWVDCLGTGSQLGRGWFERANHSDARAPLP